MNELRDFDSFDVIRCGLEKKGNIRIREKYKRYREI